MNVMPSHATVERWAQKKTATLRIDFFLHPSFYEDPDRLHRARILAFTLCTITFVSMLVILILAILPFPSYIRIFGIPYSLIEVIVFSFLLFKFKKDGSYDLCSNIAILITLSEIILATFFTGGMTYSPVSQLLAISPLLAFFFGGLRAGKIAALIIGFVITITLLIEYRGFVFPQIAQALDIRLARPLLLLICTVVLAALAFFYEYTASVLREERDKEHWKVIQLAQTDALTGLSNRRAFDEILNAHIEHHRKFLPIRSFVLCYFDLNGFKAINDRHGHDVGDQVLRAVSIRLRSALRGTDVIGRQGGDEFMLLLDDLDAGPALEATAQRFLKIIAEPIESSAGLLSIDASFGFAVFPHDALTADILKKLADSAMYKAKRTGEGWHLADTSKPLFASNSIKGDRDGN